MTREAETRRKKAEGLRYKKAAVSGLTYFEIQDKLSEIMEACDDVVYWMDSDDKTLVDALEGDEEDAARFKFDFAGLSADADQMFSDMQDIWEPERFDDILVVSGIGRQRDQSLMGYDSFEGDYFGIDPFTYEWAEQESMKRLERLTKREMLEQMAQTISITFAFVGIQSRYNDLKSAMDILRAQNKEYLDSVKQINELYDKMSDRTLHYSEKIEAKKKFDEIVEKLPQEAFL